MTAAQKKKRIETKCKERRDEVEIDIRGRGEKQAGDKNESVIVANDREGGIK